MSSSHLAIMCLIMISLVPLHQLGNADGLDFDRKCVRLLGCTGRRCICCNNAPEILKCYDTQAACGTTDLGYANVVGNADGLDFDRKCVRLLGCTGRHCICCNNAPEILKCYDTQAACMAHCTNPTI
ncbi:unnamed protein product [Brassica oleracea]